ncbi:Gp37-like protein [Actinomadura geliboluensis]|uniref:Gp37-like protein n=1 Tax=Actinomadura geliboluensis TaxID=882440 RepID=UPI0036847A5C
MAVTVEPLTTSWSRLKPLPWMKLDINAVRYNAVGAFQLTVPATAATWDLIEFDADGVLKPKTGFYVGWDGRFEVPLKAEAANPSKLINDAGEVVETIVFSGADFFALLADRLVYRDPTTTWAAQTPGSTAVTGKAETVIKQLVTANVVTAGDTNRRVPGFSVAPDLGRGGTVTYTISIKDPAADLGTDRASTAGESLMDMIRAVARQSDIGVSLTLVDGGLEFDCYLPRDLTEKVVFSERLGSLRSWSITDQTPTANAILMQTAAAATPFTETGGAGATDPWRRVEHYVDQSSTTEATQITQAQLDEVARGAAQTRVALAVVDIPKVRFGRDATGVQGYGIGDLVAADIRDGVTYTDKVTAVQLTADTTLSPYAETVTPTVGDSDAGADSTPDDATAVAQLSARVRQLEQALRSRP